MSNHAEHGAGAKRDWPIEVTLMAKLARRASCLQQRTGRCARTLCVNTRGSWLGGVCAKLTAKATIHELLRSRCKAEQRIREIDIMVARERAGTQDTEPATVKHMLREHLVAFKTCSAPRLMVGTVLRAFSWPPPSIQVPCLGGAELPWQD